MQARSVYRSILSEDTMETLREDACELLAKAGMDHPTPAEIEAQQEAKPARETPRGAGPMPKPKTKWTDGLKVRPAEIQEKHAETKRARFGQTEVQVVCICEGQADQSQGSGSGAGTSSGTRLQEARGSSKGHAPCWTMGALTCISPRARVLKPSSSHTD